MGRYVGAKDSMEPFDCLYLWANVRKRDVCFAPAPTPAVDASPNGFGWNKHGG